MATDTPPTNPNRLEALEAENAELRKRLEKLEADREVMAATGRSAGWLARYVLAGPDLVKAFEGWLRTKSISDPLPARETALLGAAVVRRVVRVSLVGLAVALLPTTLLVWQNWEMRKQRELFSQQLEHQTKDTEIVRRAQLLATIYDCADEQLLDADGNPPETCKPAAHPRARKEAAEAFVAIETSVEGRIVNLAGADLGGVGLTLRQVDLSDSVLSKANLSHATLIGVDLSHARLINANLSEAVSATLISAVRDLWMRTSAVRTSSTRSSEALTSVVRILATQT